MVLNKYADLTIKNSSDFRKYRKPAAEIKKLKVSTEPKKRKYLNFSSVIKKIFWNGNFTAVSARRIRAEINLCS